MAIPLSTRHKSLLLSTRHNSTHRRRLREPAQNRLRSERRARQSGQRSRRHCLRADLYGRRLGLVYGSLLEDEG